MDYNTAKWRIRDWFPKLSDQSFHDLRLFHVELLRFNDKMNLISVKTIVDADLHHFADSIIVSSMVREFFAGKKVYDIGSGNGFPGIIHGILNRDTQYVLVDSDLKKTEFLKHIVAQLKLTNVTVQWKRIEDLKNENAQFAISRAFAPLTQALTLTRNVFSTGAVYIHMKSQEWPIEIASLPPQICSTWNTNFYKDYELPEGKIKLCLIKSDKVK